MSRELTADEVFLLDHIVMCNSGYRLYKLYDPEEEIDGRIPDIWDAYMNALDKAEEEYDKARLEYARMDAQKAFWYKHHVDDCEQKLEHINSLVDRIEKSDAIYFACSRDLTKLSEVVRKSQAVYRPVVTDGKLSFEDTGETVSAWTIEPWIGSDAHLVKGDNDKMVTVDISSYSISSYYAFTRELPDPEILSRYKHFVCEDCSRIFEMTADEINFYTQKGLHLPKRCKTCRDIRKVTKQIRQSKKHHILKR